MFCTYPVRDNNCNSIIVISTSVITVGVNITLIIVVTVNFAIDRALWNSWKSS